ncbi:unnamed protein product [Spirodela intermedia]|uniref:Crossover junction endonuclease MUS81 n=1 Tax=Spirodela intermedia TaxID=51605 RepID=A0A7I8IW62_SPIIN|nr:unnamed protein product [Spirodela intermedia]CAA6662109.1 unnamed protein product [Spirodela intermedia]
MENQLPIRCSENEAVGLYLWTRRKEMAEHPTAISEKLDTTLAVAYRNICEAKTPIKTLKDLSRIKGVGKWILRLMKGAFQDDQEVPQFQKAAENGKKHGAPKRYLPQKNSVAYALLITLYRGITKGNEFMRKQELIDEAEASGLSRTSIGSTLTRRDNGKGKHRQYGSSAKEWYTGWSCMKTLVNRGLVVKSSCPAKYMLTEEGKEAACECLLRSGLISPDDVLGPVNVTECSGHACGTSELGLSSSVSFNNVTTFPSNDTCCDRELSNIQKDISTTTQENDHFDTSDSCSTENEEQSVSMTSDFAYPDALQRPFTLQACSKFVFFTIVFSGSSSLCIRQVYGIDYRANGLAMPPCTGGEMFEEVYDVILLLDDRENFGSRFGKVVDGIRLQFKIQVEVRRLPIGDGIWIARHKQFGSEYVLDFIVERKRIDDLYQKLRLLVVVLPCRMDDLILATDMIYWSNCPTVVRKVPKKAKCGLQKLIYLIEGDPNSSEAADRIKTAHYKKYGYLTQSINRCYKEQFSIIQNDSVKLCPTFKAFVKKCQDLEKLCVTDVFALQLMQVPQVTEEIALAVVKMYPTLYSLAHAYSALGCNVRAQEEMLKTKGNLISTAASRNIFKFVWGG